VPTTTVGDRKIDLTIEACEKLAKYVLTSQDRVAVVTCGSTARVECDFTNDWGRFLSALRSIPYVNQKEKTRLWDSIADYAIAFWKAGRRNVPWLFIAVTDGADCASTTFEKDPIGAGTFMRHRFTFEQSNFMALVGVGENEAIDKPALLNFAQAAQCPAVTIKDFTFLEEMFLKIAFQFTTALTGVRYSLGNLSWTELQRVRNLTRFPVDMLFLIDRSASMFERA
jgi:hypothetical protein